ncbi:PilZ domain-containing protein [Novosphingobium bradum]|uniref:PilZ domain-containing protein n=1 Tax=Novosphingobium bradum TaxID=1737444 RepID=A0ABV7IL55_9SPHN
MTGRSLHLTEPMIGRRRDARLRVELTARLITLDGTIRAVLADLARWGARLAAPDAAIRPGQDAVLAWDRFEAFGTVVWCGDGYLGMTFDDPLAPAVLVATRMAQDARAMPLERQLQREAAQAFVNPRYKL